MRHLAIFLCLSVALLAASCASHKPGDPAHAWVNGTWEGGSRRWEQIWKFEVVDGNKVIGSQSVRRRGESAALRSYPAEGEVTGDTVTVKVYKQDNPVYTFTKAGTDQLEGGGAGLPVTIQRVK